MKPDHLNVDFDAQRGKTDNHDQRNNRQEQNCENTIGQNLIGHLIERALFDFKRAHRCEVHRANSENHQNCATQPAITGDRKREPMIASDAQSNPEQDGCNQCTWPPDDFAGKLVDHHFDVVHD
jgi:hypothetical protein